MKIDMQITEYLYNVQSDEELDEEDQQEYD